MAPESGSDAEGAGLYTTKEVASLMHLSAQRVRDLARDGRIPGTIIEANRDHRKYLFPSGPIDRLIEAREVRLPPAQMQTVSQEVDQLKAELEQERRGRAIAESKIAELRRALNRQRDAIQALLVTDVDDSNYHPPES